LKHFQRDGRHFSIIVDRQRIRVRRVVLDALKNTWLHCAVRIPHLSLLFGVNLISEDSLKETLLLEAQRLVTFVDPRFFSPIENEYPLFLSKDFQRKLYKRLALPRSKKTGCFLIRETITQLALFNMRLRKTRDVHAPPALPAEIIVIVFDHLVNMYQAPLF
jgi:hypothetical protein